MRVLFVTPYIYNDHYRAFSKNFTGFGLLLDQMADYIGRKSEVFIFTNALRNEARVHVATVVKHTLPSILKCVKLSDFIRAYHLAFRRKRSIRERCRCIYYCINCALLRNVIKRLNPDVIHCHAAGELFQLYIDTCIESKVPVVITLHGLIGVNQVLKYSKITKEDIKSEERIFRLAECGVVRMTVISTGILNRAKLAYKIHDVSNISVIPNGIAAIDRSTRIDIYEEYGIDRRKKVCVAIGSVYQQKNQIGIVRAIAKLPQSLQDEMCVLIIGKIRSDYPIEEEIKWLNLEKTVLLLGAIPHGILGSFYSVASLNILASIDEGFGLSIIEGFQFGIPCVAFSDIDAIPDVYSEDSMLLCYERSEDALAKAIVNALHKEWNKDAIRKHADLFRVDMMAERYINLYNDMRCKPNGKLAIS